MNSIETDQKQRELALDATQSFIVQAPAGSGKTELLIQRFLTLLNCVKAPEEILAITFTKKAASEMRLRVIKALKSAMTEDEPEKEHGKKTWHLAKKVLQRDKQFNWNIIYNPNQLRIQTIDSLCAFLTKQLPLLSHFGSQPSLSTYPAALYREAVQEVLTHVEENFEWSHAISKLLLHLDNDLNKLHDLLVLLLAKRDQWLPYLKLDTHDTEIKARLEKHLQLVVNDYLQQLTELIPQEFKTELLAIARFAADQLALSQSTSNLLALRSLQEFPPPLAQYKDAWIGLAQLLLTKSFSWRKRVDAEIGFPALAQLKNANEKAIHTDYRQRLMQLITSLSDHEELRIALSELFFLPKTFYNDEQWAILKALLQVLKIVAAQLRVTFKQHGQIDFIENAQAAFFALGSDDHPTDLALALDYQIQHILVDEFQDTSLTQYQLLEKMTAGWETNDGRTLFVVGDPMQSIYRFREAEVGLFIRMQKNGIGLIKLKPLTLATNFRSIASLVEWNNAKFSHIFPAFNDIAKGAVTFSPSVSLQEPSTSDPAENITVRGFVNACENAQAMDMISTIQQLKQAHPDEKIAILVRSRGHLATLIPLLKKAKIAYHAVDIDSLASRQMIQDLLALTSAMLHPADRVAWLAVLRAPWCGLTLSDLLLIAGNSPHITLFEQLDKQAVIAQLSAEGQSRINKLFPILKKKIAERERYPLRQWVENTWLLLGGPACLKDPAEIEDANAFFQLLETISEVNPSVQAETLKEKVEQLYAASQHTDTPLQIMTIHTAKGLEFDTVILPHLERKIPHDDKSLLAWMERPLSNDQVSLLLAPIHAIGETKDTIYEFIHRQQRLKSNYEIDRLFYVAVTRAKKRLFLYFNTTQNEKGEFKTESGSFLERLWPLIEKEKENFLISQQPLEDIDKEDEVKTRYITRLASDWKNPVAEKQETMVTRHKKQSGFQLLDYQPKLVGITTHRILQLISQQGAAWWQNETTIQQKNYIKRYLKQQGVTEKQLTTAINLTFKAISNTLNDARGRWILKAHKEAASEYALSAILNNKLEKLIIDRTFIDEDGIRWIIDYKTTTFSHADLEAFLEEEQEKYLEKMKLYQQAMALINPEPIRLGLYFPAISAWKEW